MTTPTFHQITVDEGIKLSLLKQLESFSETAIRSNRADLPPLQNTWGEQLKRVYEVMQDGIPRTLAVIAYQARGPEASVSARLRELRKLGYIVERKKLESGLYSYRILSPSDAMKEVPVPDTTKVYRGFLKNYSNGEDDNLLTLTGLETIRALAEEIEEDIRRYGSYLSVRYYTTDKEIPADEIDAAFLGQLYGDGKANYGCAYSEITGYLWTDEEINVGGHDLLKELKGNLGKFCHLEITYHKSPK